jgi:hypothetical protein
MSAAFNVRFTLKATDLLRRREMTLSDDCAAKVFLHW